MKKYTAGLMILAALAMYSCTKKPVSSEFVLESGKYLSTPFQLNKQTHVTVEVKVLEGHAVNVFLMDAEMFSSYAESRKEEGSAAGGEFKYLSELSARNTKACNRETILPVGDYAIVVASTDKPGFIQDKNNASVKLEIIFRKAQ